ncbi:hypothetical protein PVAP13_9NG642400 [Panicum virgatum]|uniref:Sugar phosphate transporter domain-containing protein n=1 Tax=Panicum virgatum TaxID=38727 RepID=A0A8T0N5X4_PANVG|nr:hypothetical protein PVAP13_9NG642400 [Panicum virgatum]
MANSRVGRYKMSNLSDPSKEDASPEGSGTIQKTGAWSNTLNTLLQQASVYGVAAGYCLSASLLSIINKWAVMKFLYPGALTALQYFTSVAGVLLCGQLKLIEHDGLNLRTMWKFLPAAVMFYISIFTNSELLLHANVDTFIVFRSAVPIFVAIGETLYLHQPWPLLMSAFTFDYTWRKCDLCFHRQPIHRDRLHLGGGLPSEHVH